MSISDYVAEPDGSFVTRRQAFLEFAAAYVVPPYDHRPPDGFKYFGWQETALWAPASFFSQIARLALNITPIDERPIHDALRHMLVRRHCLEFGMAGLLRILYKYRGLLTASLITEIEDGLLQAPYWWDEPNPTETICWHTENHQILFHSAELLAGQLFPERIFKNSGMTGRQHVEKGQKLVRQWLRWRAQYGYSEWLSNTYYAEDMMALLNIYDFAMDEELQTAAAIQIDRMLLEMALHSHRGLFCATHGRAYVESILDGSTEETSAASRILFGMGACNDACSFIGNTLATSGYRLPPVIEAIAQHAAKEVQIHQKMSVTVEDAVVHGLRPDSLEDMRLFVSVQDYYHPLIIETIRKLWDTYHLWYRPDFETAIAQYAQERMETGRIINKDYGCYALTEVHVETFRTSQYALSCAQDFRAGRRGCQHHIWQATFGPTAVVFTNHPGSNILSVDHTKGLSNFWAGNRVLPRAAQYRNVLVCLYNVPENDPIPFSHAYFPQDAFDEVVERNGWVMARAGDGFIALHSDGGQWASDGPFARCELRVNSPRSAWICEMGTRAQWDGFPAFVEAIASSRIQSGSLNVSYESPSIGLVEFAWDGPWRVKGAAVPLRYQSAFETPYTMWEDNGNHLNVTHDGHWLKLDFAGNHRHV